MKIYYKMLLGYLLGALLACGVGYVGVGLSQRIQHGFKQVAEDVIGTERSLAALRFYGLRVVASTVEMAYIDKIGAASQRPDELRLLENAKKSLAAALEACRRKMLQDPAETVLIRDIELKCAVLQQNSEAFLAASAKSSSAMAAKERFEIAEQDFLEAVDHAYQKEEVELAESKTQVNHELASSLVLMPGVSVVAFLLALICGAVISASLARRLKTLQRGVERVSQGDFEVRLESDSSDEVGALSHAFNGMVQELRRSKEEIVATNKDLDRIIHSMVDALFVVSAEGTVHSVNAAACDMLRYRMNELVGQSFTKVFLDEAQYESLQQTLGHDGLISEIESTCRTKEGTAVPVSFSASVMEKTASGSEHRVWIAHNISSRKEAEQEIEQLAYYDQLTGLPNRFLFHDRLRQAMARAQREKGKVALLFFDLDRFKDINDTLGHASGDRLLQLVSQRIQSFVRQSDTLARLGGDEFVLLCCGSGEINVETVAKKILELFEVPFDLDGNEGYVTASIGIVFYPTDGTDASTLLRNADLAMYAAKETGRNAYRYFSQEMNQQAQERKDLEVMLRKALLLDQFSLHYQPQIDLATGSLYGVEALLRWRHPERGMIPPVVFIPVAEQTGLIRAIGEWVLHEACRQGRAWMDAGYAPVSIAVNVSGAQFLHPGFHTVVENVLRETGLEPSLLELEITESVFMSDPKETAQSLKRLKELRVRLAVDDFGTGYSSLSYLMDFPLDRLKIDKSFIRGISERDHSTVIVDAVIAMGHSLGVRVLAEGVETAEELAYLKAQGCDEAQGYYFSRPVPPDEAGKLIAMPWSQSALPSGEDRFSKAS